MTWIYTEGATILKFGTGIKPFDSVVVLRSTLQNKVPSCSTRWFHYRINNRFVAEKILCLIFICQQPVYKNIFVTMYKLETC